jgi:hypothetical protein
MAIAVGASQKAQSASTAALTTVAITTAASGSSFLVFPVYVTGNLAASTPITDSKGNTYTAIGTEITNGGIGISCRPYLCTNGTGGAGHTFTMANAGTSIASMMAVEITGGLTASLLDQYVASVVSSGPPYNQPVTTSAQADELVLALGISNSSAATVNYTVGGSFTKQQEQTDGATVVSMCLASRVVSATGSYDPAWNPSAGTTVTAITLSLKAAAAGGSTATATPGVGAVNTSGLTPSMNPFTNVRIREVLVNEAGSPVANQTGIHLVVWYSGFPSGAADLSYSNMTTDPAGTTSWSLATGTLVYNQRIFYVSHDGHPSLSVYTCAQMMPTYS